MANPLVLNPFQFIDNNGDPLAFGSVETFQAGTSTRKPSYTDASEASVNPNPVPLDGGGRAAIWGAGAYKLIIRDQNNNVVETRDMVEASLDEAYFESFSGTGSQTEFTTSEDLGTEATSLMIFTSDSDLPLIPDDDYTIAGTTLTLTVAPEAGTDNIRVYAPSLNVGAALSAASDALAAQAAAEAAQIIAEAAAESAEESAEAAAGGTLGDISAFPTVTPTRADITNIGDQSDSFNNKKSTLGAILDLEKAQAADGTLNANTLTVAVTDERMKKIAVTGNGTIDITPQSGVVNGGFLLIAYTSGTITWSGVDDWVGAAPTLGAGNHLFAFVHDNAGNVIASYVGPYS